MKISEVIDLSWRYGAETRLAPGSVPMQIRKSGCTANGDADERRALLRPLWDAP